MYGKGTMTGLALRHLVEHNSEVQGARPRAQNVPRVGLVFTDGRSQDDISVWAARAKEEDIITFGVWVGKAVEEGPREIAEQHVSYSPDFSTMTHMLESLKVNICPESRILEISQGFLREASSTTVRLGEGPKARKFARCHY